MTVYAVKVEQTRWITVYVEDESSVNACSVGEELAIDIPEWDDEDTSTESEEVLDVAELHSSAEIWTGGEEGDWVTVDEYLED